MVFHVRKSQKNMKNTNSAPPLFQKFGKVKVSTALFIEAYRVTSAFRYQYSFVTQHSERCSVFFIVDHFVHKISYTNIRIKWRFSLTR